MADEPTLGEINRSVQDVKNELRAMRGELVRGDVYTANRSADDLRIRAVEADLKRIEDDRSAMRRLVYGAIFSAAGSVVVTGIIAVANNKP
jgi:hypothetical protein